MKSSTLRSLVLLGILTTFVVAMTPSMVVAGDSPEPGPPSDTVKYTYVPPPFIGDNMVLKLYDPDGVESFYDYGLYIVSGIACQIGKSGCCIDFDNYLVADEAELDLQGLLGISCAELKARYFMNEYTEVPSEGVSYQGTCADALSEIEGIDIIAVANINCVEEDGAASQGWAQIIFIGWAQK